MFISTLGKDPSNRDEDEMYGELIRDILGNDDDDDEDETEKTTTDVSAEKVGKHNGYMKTGVSSAMYIKQVKYMLLSKRIRNTIAF